MILGDITERFIDLDLESGISSSMVSMFYDRPETETSSSNQFSLSNSNMTKIPSKKQSKNLLDQNLKNYSSVPTKQTKILRAWNFFKMESALFESNYFFLNKWYLFYLILNMNIFLKGFNRIILWRLNLINFYKNKLKIKNFTIF